MSERPRNPFRNEADAFRVLVMFAAGCALVAAVTLVAGSIAGVAVALALLALGAWRSWGLWRSWR